MTGKAADMLPMAFITLILLAACSCTRTVYVAAETAAQDTSSSASVLTEGQFQALHASLKQTASVRDSVAVRDSVVIIVNQQGDVISRERFRDRERSTAQAQATESALSRYESAFTALREEVLAISRKTEQVPVPVEKKLSRWEKIKQDAGAAAIGAVGVGAVFLVAWLARRLRRRG